MKTKWKILAVALVILIILAGLAMLPSNTKIRYEIMPKTIDFESAPVCNNTEHTITFALKASGTENIGTGNMTGKLDDTKLACTPALETTELIKGSPVAFACTFSEDKTNTKLEVITADGILSIQVNCA